MVEGHKETEPILRSLDYCLEGPGGREIWATLTVPEKTLGPPVVMAHGFLGFKDWAFFPWLAGRFAQAGLPALRFNFSGSGMGPANDGPFTELEAFEKDTISKQVEDLHSILTSIKLGRFGPDLPAAEKVFLWGHSRGGGICLLGAGNRPEVAALAAWATIARVNRYFYEAKKAWRDKGFSSVESARTGQLLRYSTDFLEDAEKWGASGDVPTYLHHLKVPTILLHGSNDTSVLPEESESLAAIHPQVTLSILAGADHKFNSVHPFTGPSPAVVEAAERTIGFFRDIAAEL